jgi:hypothetical protein
MSTLGAPLRSLAAGSLPHTDPGLACDRILAHLDIPTWPQLPKRSFKENMYVQYSEQFPGVVLAEQRIYVDRRRDLDQELAGLYHAYLTDDPDHAAISPEYAAGLYHFLALDLGAVGMIKGQITGPVSWGLTVGDQDRKPLVYDDVLGEAVAVHLKLKAAWLERRLRELSPRTIVFLDEPYMSSFGSAFIALEHERVVALLQEVLAGIQGLKGIHCCGNTDWSLLMSTTIDVINLDAYGYAESLALYPEAVQAFLQRGGIVAWGIVPAGPQVLDETVDSLIDRFHHALSLLTAKGLHRDDLLAAALIMPSCGCGTLPVETAERVLALTGQVARALQARYG